MTPEGRVQDECMRWLHKNGWYAYITKNQGTYDEDQKTYRKGSVFAVRGISDAIAIKDGIVVFIEFKAAKGVQSEHQKKFETAISRHGGRYILIRSVEELHDKLLGNDSAADK